MWTLILVIFLVSGSSNGGVGTATSFLDFPNEAKCRTAADVMGATQQVTLAPPGSSSSSAPTSRKNFSNFRRGASTNAPVNYFSTLPRPNRIFCANARPRSAPLLS
jgi:hypothetical protein